MFKNEVGWGGVVSVQPSWFLPWAMASLQGSHLAHLWATSDSAPRSEAVGTPQAAGVM